MSGGTPPNARTAGPAGPSGAGAVRASRWRSRSGGAGGAQRHTDTLKAKEAGPAGTAGRSRRGRRRARRGRHPSRTRAGSRIRAKPSRPGAARRTRPAACSSAGPGWRRVRSGRTDRGPRTPSPPRDALAPRAGRRRPTRCAQRRRKGTSCEHSPGHTARQSPPIPARGTGSRSAGPARWTRYRYRIFLENHQIFF